MAGLFAAVLAVAGLVAFAQSDLGSNTNYNSSGWAGQYPPFSANEIALTVTNGQEIAVFGGNSYVITAIGQAAYQTNTITIAQPYRVAGRVNVRVDSASTNFLLIADNAALVALGSNLTLRPTDTAVFNVAKTNEMSKISSSANY